MTGVAEFFGNLPANRFAAEVSGPFLPAVDPAITMGNDKDGTKLVIVAWKVKIGFVKVPAGTITIRIEEKLTGYFGSLNEPIELTLKSILPDELTVMWQLTSRVNRMVGKIAPKLTHGTIVFRRLS